MLDLSGKTALVTGIANNKSIAWGIAQQLHQAGAKLAITYLPDDRDRTLSKVKDLVEPLAPDLLLPCDVQNDAQIDEMYGAISKSWERLDILIHCLAFAKREELSGNFTDISRDGFKLALDVSAFSLISLCKGARPLMKEGGSVITLTYIGGVKVVPNYNIMGIAKAALEMNVKYLAQDLGSQNIRVNGISAGPIRTLASAAIGDIHKMLHHVQEVSPLKRLVSQVEVEMLQHFWQAISSAITGQILYADCGYEIMGA